MNTLHIKPNTQTTQNNKKFRFLCVNENILQRQPESEIRDNNIFSNETLKSLGDLGNVLRSIHERMINCGYIIKDGIIIKNENK